MDWTDVITKSGAALGTGLGIFNTWHAWRQRKVHIRVTPTTVETKRNVGQDNLGQVIYEPFLSPGITVVNLSSFPVTLEEVGYDIDAGPYRLSRLDGSGHFSNVGPGYIWTTDKLPQRLEARASLQVAWDQKDEENLKGKQVRRAYAKTVCGTTARSSRNAPALRMISERLIKGLAVLEPVEK